MTIDGKFYKRTPFSPVELEQGVHNVDLEDSPTHRVHKQITITAGQQVTVDVDMTAN